MEHPGADEPIIENRRYIESPASKEELEELALLAGQLLEQSEMVYGAESIRRCPEGTLTLQSNVYELDGINTTISSIFVTGPNYPGDAHDILAEFDFSEDYDYPIQSYYGKNPKQAREILIALISTGNLDEVETEIALYCIRQFAADIEGYYAQKNVLSVDGSGEMLRFVDLISNQVGVRNKDFISNIRYSYEDIQDEFELTVASLATTNPHRYTNLPRLKIVMDEYGSSRTTSIIVKPDGSVVATETDRSSDDPLEEVDPEVYHVRKLRAAIVTALSNITKEEEEEEEAPTFTMPVRPFDELLSIAERAWSIYYNLPDYSEIKDNAAEAYKRATELLSKEFEWRYHLTGKAAANGANVNMDNLPLYNQSQFLGTRNMLILLAPTIFVETADGYCRVAAKSKDTIKVEYSHLEGGTLIDTDKNSISDIFLIGKPNKQSNGGHCLVPLSRCVVLQYVPANN